MFELVCCPSSIITGSTEENTLPKVNVHEVGYLKYIVRFTTWQTIVSWGHVLMAN